ncbi:Oxalate--CoA ligase-like protein [Drosera capensis]
MAMAETSTLTGLLRQTSAKFASRRAISALEDTISRTLDLIDAASSRLLAAGVRPRDFVIMFLAVIRVRATAAQLNAAYTADEFEFYLSDSDSKLLITNREGNAAAQSAASKLNIPHAMAHLSEAESEIEISVIESDSVAISLDEVVNEADDVALFLHTSGTTSRPKGVPLTQLNLVSSVKNIKLVY